jgi:enediyne biosynthesis protein E4
MKTLTKAFQALSTPSVHTERKHTSMKTNSTRSRMSELSLTVLLFLAAAGAGFGQPVITQQPQNQTNCQGDTVSFSVEATGASPLTYQWRSHSGLTVFTNLPGETNAVLVVTNVRRTWRYSVVVSDASSLSVTSAVVRVAVNFPFGITGQPAGATLEVGSTFTCSVVVSNSTSVTYQWYCNDQPLPGKTIFGLTITNIQPSDAGDYWVVVANPWCGSQTSQTARLDVVHFPPGFTQQPASAGVELGSPFTCSVLATGRPPLFYQWCFQGAALPGKTTTNLFFSSFQSSNVGEYFVVVTNVWGAATSQVATLTGVVAGVSFINVVNSPIVSRPGFSLAGAWADFDGDGWLDLCLTRGADTGLLETNLLFRNLGQGNFVQVTTEPFASDVGGFDLPAWADYNNDGRPDLFIAAWDGPTRLYRNDGAGGFVRLHDPALESRGAKGFVPACGDFDQDGQTDVFVSFGDSATLGNVLLRNSGDGTFGRVSAGDIYTDRPGNACVGAEWADSDNDGRLDLIVTSSTTGVMLYTNRGDGTLWRLHGAPFENHPGAVFPVWGDYDGDGVLDLFVAAGTWGGQNALYHNDGKGGFTRIPWPESGASVMASWGDYDNDGWLDLFVARGNMVSQTCQLYKNNGDGTFTRINSLALTQVSKHWINGSWVDHDNDGFLDLFVVACYVGETNALYHNEDNGNQWLVLKLAGTASNRDALGAKVRVRATIGGESRWQLRQLGAGGVGLGDPRAHFGLGDATNAEIVRVEWPSGQVTELRNVASKQILTVTEPPGLQILGKPSDHLDLRVTAHAGMSWDLHASTHLHGLGETCPDTNGHWQLVLSGTNASRTVAVSDTNCAGASIRFYKAVAR